MFELILFSTVIVERLTEWFAGAPFDHFPRLTPFKWMLMYVAGALGILVAIVYGLDMFVIVGQETSLLGQILTGVAVGGGANFVHDIVGKVTDILGRFASGKSW